MNIVKQGADKEAHITQIKIYCPDCEREVDIDPTTLVIPAWSDAELCVICPECNEEHFVL